MRIFGYTPAQIKKCSAAAVGFVVAVLMSATTNNLVPQKYLPWALAILGALTTKVVFSSKNDPRPGQGLPEESTPPV